VPVIAGEHHHAPEKSDAVYSSIRFGLMLSLAMMGMMEANATRMPSDPFHTGVHAKAAQISITNSYRSGNVATLKPCLIFG